MRIFELSSFEIRTNSMMDRWKKFSESYRARGQQPDVAVFNQWFVENFRGQGKQLNPEIAPIPNTNPRTIAQYLKRALSYYDTGDLWKETPKAKQKKALDEPATDVSAGTPQQQPAQPAAQTDTQLNQAPETQEIELPGTNYKYKLSPSWLDATGKPASEAVARVLNQLAAGKTGADIPVSDLQRARQAVGISEAKKIKRKQISRYK
jgi:hypothetical protein